jgi:UDP-N-acetylmuramoyl-L-alanyl-D-glutamate--2,6-diaminopimelate ligase
VRSLIRRLIPGSVLQPLLHAYHYALAVSGEIRYGFPAKKMRVVMVTGTNGKTTTTLLIAHILREQGEKVGVSSSTSFGFGEKIEPNLTNRTNPGRWQYAGLLSRMRAAGCDVLVTEAASEGISWSRLWGVPTDTAVFTNLSEDHLDYHGTMEQYRNAKGYIFRNLTASRRLPGVPKVSVVNADDAEAPYFIAFGADVHSNFAFSNSATLIGRQFTQSSAGLQFSVTEAGKGVELRSSLIGTFNAENILAAAAAARGHGLGWPQIQQAVASFEGVPGRLERVDDGQDFAVYVDYAHTEDALKNLYETLREVTAGRLIAVLGATGDRQKDKRPRLGAVAAELCDLVYITDEEPYTEEPKKIIEAVAEGVRTSGKKTEGKDFFVVDDRAAAIREAVAAAGPNDAVVLTGIGHQVTRTVGTHKEPWDDRIVARNALIEAGKTTR